MALLGMMSDKQLGQHRLGSECTPLPSLLLHDLVLLPAWRKDLRAESIRADPGWLPPRGISKHPQALVEIRVVGWWQHCSWLSWSKSPLFVLPFHTSAFLTPWPTQGTEEPAACCQLCPGTCHLLVASTAPLTDV